MLYYGGRNPLWSITYFNSSVQLHIAYPLILPSSICVIEWLAVVSLCLYLLLANFRQRNLSLYMESIPGKWNSCEYFQNPQQRMVSKNSVVPLVVFIAFWIDFQQENTECIKGITQCNYTERVRKWTYKPRQKKNTVFLLPNVLKVLLKSELCEVKLYTVRLSMWFDLQ